MILGRTADELAQLAAADEQPAYRGKQLMDGVLNGARSIDDIGNVSTSHPSLRAYCGYTLAARMFEGDLCGDIHCLKSTRACTSTEATWRPVLSFAGQRRKFASVCERIMPRGPGIL